MSLLFFVNVTSGLQYFPKKYFFDIATSQFRKFNFAWRTCKATLLFVGDNSNYLVVIVIPYGKTNANATISLWTCPFHSLVSDNAKVFFDFVFVRTA